MKQGVIEVRGKAMNRTALGIVDAMFQLYPGATFDQMKEMLPDSINPSAPVNYKSLFKPYTERLYGVIQPATIIQECEGQDINIHNSHFTEPEARFKTADGREVLVSRTWESSDSETGENDLQKLIDHVQQYGVRVIQVEKKQAFNKGEYHLEVINPALLAILTQPEKSSPLRWLWILGVLLAIIAAIFVLKTCNKDEKAKMTPPAAPAAFAPSATPPTPPTAFDSISRDIAEGESVDNRKVTFHNILFEKGKSSLQSSSDAILNQVSDFLNRFPDLKMDIIGHCSDEGTAEINQKLSEERAKAVFVRLVSDSVDAKRLTYKGMGSAYPLAQGSSDSARILNRRTEFIIQQEKN